MGSISTQDPVEPPLVESSFDVPTAPYPTASTAAIPSSPTEVKDIAIKTIKNLNSMLDSKDYSLLSSLMLKSASYWRDHLGLSQTKFTTLSRPQEIVAYIQENGGECSIKRFILDPSKEAAIVQLDPKGTINCIDVFVTFETETARGKGILKLIQDVEESDAWKIYTIFTSLTELKEFPFQDGFSRPLYSNPESVSEKWNWKDYREHKKEFVDEEPAVIVVGKEASVVTDDNNWCTA